jgi:low affinity Fe/Cu permease
MNMTERFHQLAVKASNIVGSPSAFIVAVSIIFLWAVSGPVFKFSNSWQLFINTGTTIVTLLMVILIQNTQNRDSKAIHLKLDELLKAVKGARTSLVDLEEMSDGEIEELHEQFKSLHEKYQRELDKRREKGKD